MDRPDLYPSTEYGGEIASCGLHGRCLSGRTLVPGLSSDRGSWHGLAASNLRCGVTEAFMGPRWRNRIAVIEPNVSSTMGGTFEHYDKSVVEQSMGIPRIHAFTRTHFSLQVEFYCLGRFRH